MSILKIARMGHPVLLEPAAPLPVDRIGADAATQALIDDMIETLADAGGVGLAAPQIYRGQRIVLAMAPPERAAGDAAADLTVLINPELELRGEEPELGWEGCLSIPGLRGAVPRAPEVRYAGYGRDGGPVEGVATGFFARVLQHEVDHLNGVLYPMRMRDFRYFGFDEELNRLERAAASAAESEER